MFKWIKLLFNLDRLETQSRLAFESSKVALKAAGEASEAASKVRDMLRDRTSVNADLDMKGQSFIILVGKYGSKDYVEVIRTRNFTQHAGLINHLKELKAFGNINVVDAPPVFRAAVERINDFL